MIELGSRRVVHFGVTRHPTDAWVAQQLRQATPYGRAPRFLIRDNDRRYGPEFIQVALSRSESVPAQRAEAVLDAQPHRRWHTLHWKEGSRGWLKVRFVAVRCWRVDGEGRRRIGWLIGQRPPRGETGDAKQYWSDFPAHMALERMVEYTHRRHWVEQYHEEAKGELGWDQYQGRLWTGFHRNAVLVMLSFSFLVSVDHETALDSPSDARPCLAGERVMPICARGDDLSRPLAEAGVGVARPCGVQGLPERVLAAPRSRGDSLKVKRQKGKAKREKLKVES